MHNILICILEFLPANKIYEIINILYNDTVRDKYYEIINIIYFKLYKKLYDSHLINNRDISALVYNTYNVFIMGHSYIYSHKKNIKFSHEEICIRNIIFRKFNNIGVYDVDDFLYNQLKIECKCNFIDDDEFECNCQPKITSLYYLLYKGGYHDLVSRFVGDGIVISPFECTHSNVKRNTMHYYGGDHTLRMALRFQNYNMAHCILYHIEYLLSKRELFNTIFWNNNNVLYECLYLNNNDIIGFNIMLNFAKKHKFLKKILLEISDQDMSHSNDNNFIDYTSENKFGDRYGDNIGDDNIIQEYCSNLLIDSLSKDLHVLFDNYFQINGHGWDWGVISNFNNGDFNIVNKKDFNISDKFIKYLDMQFYKLIEYCMENIEQMTFFNTINSMLQEYHINIFSLYYKRKANGIQKNEYLLLELFKIKSKNQDVFLILFLILEQLYNVEKINKNFSYNKNFTIINKFSKNFTIIEYLKDIIYCDLYNEFTFNDSDNFVFFVNYLLCYRLLNGSWAEKGC
jgi:hypothetical protein